MPCSDLVDGDADSGLRVAFPWADAVQPRLFDDPVRARALTALVAQPGDNGDVLAERLQRLDDERKVEVAANLLRLPLVLKRALWKVHEAQARTRHRRRLCQQR